MRPFFADDQTAFVVTADYGMSDWGSHGDGHPDNTQMLLIAWGMVVPCSKTRPIGSVARGHDDFSADWHLDHVDRNDAAQDDIAVLMVSLAGIPFPVNSVGRLPLSYIDVDESGQAEAIFVNAPDIWRCIKSRSVIQWPGNFGMYILRGWLTIETRQQAKRRGSVESMQQLTRVTLNRQSKTARK